MLRVAIAPDAPLVAEGTAAMLSRAAPEIVVIPLVQLGDDPGPVDILLYDPARHAVADLANVRRHSPLALVVAFSWSTRADIIDGAQRDGAAGFLSKELSADELVAAVRALHGRHQYPFLVLPLTRAPSPSARTRPQGLSERELEVLQLITAGYSNDEIARRLFLSINSVKTYVRSGYRKIGATRRTQAVLWGVEQGLASAADNPA